MPFHEAAWGFGPSHYVEIPHNEPREIQISRISVQAMMLSCKIPMGHTSAQHLLPTIIKLLKIKHRFYTGNMVPCYFFIMSALVHDESYFCCFLFVYIIPFLVKKKTVNYFLTF